MFRNRHCSERCGGCSGGLCSEGAHRSNLSRSRSPVHLHLLHSGRVRPQEETVGARGKDASKGAGELEGMVGQMPPSVANDTPGADRKSSKRRSMSARHFFKKQINQHFINLAIDTDL